MSFEVLIGLDELVHARLDGLEVIVAETLPIGKFEVVVEAMFDRRADRKSGAGMQVENRLGHEMGGRVPNRLQAEFIGAGHELYGRTVGQRDVEVDLFAVHDRNQRSFGQPRPDVGREVVRGATGWQFTARSVR